MQTGLSRLITTTAILLAAIIGSASAQETRRPQEPTPFSIPDNVNVRKAAIWSEGTRLAANLYSPKSAAGKLPTIIMAYGWGGTMKRFRSEDVAFAQAGYDVYGKARDQARQLGFEAVMSRLSPNNGVPNGHRFPPFSEQPVLAIRFVGRPRIPRN